MRGNKKVQKNRGVVKEYSDSAKFIGSGNPPTDGLGKLNPLSRDDNKQGKPLPCTAWGAIKSAMEAYPFEVLILAITGLRTELRGEIAAGFTSVRQDFASVRQDLDVIRKQTATSVETLVDHESRIIHLEGPTS